jgi:hypothetical protein
MSFWGGIGGHLYLSSSIIEEALRMGTQMCLTPAQLCTRTSGRHCSRVLHPSVLFHPVFLYRVRMKYMVVLS